MTRFFVSIGKSCVVALLALLLASPLNAQASLTKALDFDGDGKADYTVFRLEGNLWFTYGSTGAVWVQPMGIASEDFQTPGDFDGDGRADWAVWREQSAFWYILKSSDNTLYGFPWGSPGDEPVARDYDGDGRTDPATARRQNGVIYWWILRSSDYGYDVYHWGLDSDFVAPGDYDGDGKFDVAIQHGGEASGDPAYWYILQSRDGIKVIQFGQTDDTIVPGDYDGDGKTDLAIVREDPDRADGLAWYIMPSSGNGSFYGIPWGIASTDIITQGDYDGDGRTDLATWRDTTGTFWVLYSGTYGALAVKWGESNDKPIAGYDNH